MQIKIIVLFFDIFLDELMFIMAVKNTIGPTVWNLKISLC